MGVNTKKIFPKSFMAFLFSERLEESKVERLPVNLMSPTYKKRDLLYRKVKSRWSYMPWSRTIQSQVRRYSTFLRMPFLRVLFCPTRMGYSACPWTAACKALRACFWGQLATLWGPPQRKQRRGLEFVVEAPELFDEDDSFLWTGFTSPSPKLDRSILGMSIRLGSPCIPSPPRRKRLKGGRDRPWPHYCSACFPKREEATLTLLVF